MLPAPALPAQPARPNLVVITTDDQRATDMVALPKTRRLLGARGTIFEDSYVSYSLCCPSRTTFLTGQYSHNHGVTWNFAPQGGYERFKQLGMDNTLPVWLQRAGYHTGLIGKYLNEYGEKDPLEIPPGWSDWQGSVDPSTYQYYGFTLNDNGRLVRYGDSPRDYMTDVYSRRAVRFIRRRSARRDPFFLWVTPNAPHTVSASGRAEGTPPVPAPRHADALAGRTLPRKPNFDEADVADKPAIIRGWPRVGALEVERAQTLYLQRLRSLLAVDDLVHNVVAELRRSGELDRTLIVFTSDNGWLLGEHRVVGQKYFGFEESIRVPLIIRGPGFASGRVAEDLALNVDLAPTLLAAAGVRPRRQQDGYALQRTTRRPGLLRERDMIIETGPNSFGLPYYTGLHTRRYQLEEITTDEVELYDLRRDPYQLENVAADPRYARVRSVLHRRLARLADCGGAACRSRLGSPEPKSAGRR